ncbi:MAG: GDP-mannose 4,6-dehydratase [Candidatus Brocadiia bacterium]
MKYLVTGATAFAGCHLTKLLLTEGHTVYATSRRTNGSETDVLDTLTREEFDRIHWLFCDFTDKSSCVRVMKADKFDGVFHLGAQSHPPTSFQLPFYTQTVNVLGSLNLLEALKDNQPDTRFLFCSTSEVYGAPELKDGERMDESWQIAPVNPYAASKAAFDLFVCERVRNNFLDGLVTRAFSHTGPKRGRIFSISSDAFQIAAIALGKQAPVIHVGNLTSRRVVADVRDVVRAYYLLMTNPALKGVYNVGGEGVHTMKHYLDEMVDIAGLAGKVTTEIDQKLWRPIDIPIQVPNTDKLRRDTGWQPTIPLRQTLSDLLDYWRRKLA